MIILAYIGAFLLAIVILALVTYILCAGGITIAIAFVASLITVSVCATVIIIIKMFQKKKKK